jgi:hypothetical protein
MKKASQQFQTPVAQTSNLRFKLTGSLAKISRNFSIPKLAMYTMT